MIDPAKLPKTWTAVAQEARGSWVPTSIYTVIEIQSLYNSGLILMAQRRSKPTLDQPIPPMELVIKAKP